ncbi:NAD(P)/FAD-dependent oxidoreductase [candidate division KSB1 bacterium]|nr:NAD(P)/FAD-dependent oxidoreductase [candidate division KSB1 bacterium]
MQDKSITIIGAGFAGLSTGIYAQMNGYKSQIFEMHDKPGGLCTAWKRKGYTIDGCIHWLVGSSPESGMHGYWREVGIAQGLDIIDLDEYMRFETDDGRTLIFYTDVNRLENFLLEFSPQDEKPIREFINGIRLCLKFDMPSEFDPPLKRLIKSVKAGLFFTVHGQQMKKWMKTSMADFAARFQDPALNEAFKEMWGLKFSIIFLLFTFAWLHKKDAGYPIGGSMPMSEALAKRYTDLGGVIFYGRRVEKILVENEQAVGVRFSDGREIRSNRVLSAADGHATIFDMLEGKYTDEQVREPYKNWPIFPPLVYVGVGVSRSFDDEPQTVSGFSFPLQKPVKIAGVEYSRIPVHIYNQDPTLAPAGKTSLVVMLHGSYTYWKKLAKDEKAYKAEKTRAAKTVVDLLEQRFPGISGQVEMTDVATPLTFERYTGNWQGSFEGWLLTPQNASTMVRRMKQTLPGLQNFYMCGQWVEPGGGLPTGVMSGRRLVKMLCKEDGVKFAAKVG